MYQDLADVYDRFVDWPARLARELPPLIAWLGPACRVADVACGTGGHAIALAQRGYDVVGFDAAESAVERARLQAASHNVTVEFVRADFGKLREAVHEPFDALLCLGNSLPHVITELALHNTMADFAQLLRPGGRMLLGMRNLALAVTSGERWLPPKGATDPDGGEWLFDRLYDWRNNGRIDFNFIVYHRPPGGRWERRVHQTRLKAWSSTALSKPLEGWAELTLSSDLAGTPFDPASSGDLFLSARRPA